MNAPPLQLRDIHLPGEPSWWPPAPGWWLLALLLAALAYALLRWALRWRRKRRRQRELQAEFAAMVGISDPMQRLQALSALLRRAARLVDPLAAALQGEAWLAFLDQHCGDQSFTRGPGRVLLDAPYRPTVRASEVEALLTPARRVYASMVQAR